MSEVVLQFVLKKLDHWCWPVDLFVGQHLSFFESIINIRHVLLTLADTGTVGTKLTSMVETVVEGKSDCMVIDKEGCGRDDGIRLGWAEN